MHVKRPLPRPTSPREALARLLSEKGISEVCVPRPVNRRRLREQGLQEIAVYMLVEEAGICRARGGLYCKTLSTDMGVEIGVPSREGRSFSYQVSKRCTTPVLSWQNLYEMLPSPPLPAFVVDLSRRSMHTEEELRSLKVQLALSLSVVRRYLWDPHLILSGADEGVRPWLSDMVGDAKMIISGEKPGKILWNMRADKVIILRPDAEKPLRREEVLEADAFLLGGIVDKIPRPGVSRFLDASVPWGVARRIELRGSLVGVPDRLNRIIEIILRVIFEDAGIEEAVLASMTRRDVRRRLHVEIMRASRGGRVPLDRDHYESLRRWLPIDYREYVEVAEKAGVRLGWDCEGQDNSGG